jgi:EAL and modified HD-GYP domain-containing signal transduction protein
VLAGDASGRTYQMSADGKLFVARQPIFTRKSGVFGYELLFRSGAENVFGAEDGNQATAELISGDILTFGLEQLSGGKPAFINFTRELLLGDYYTLLPRGTVVELLEDIEPDDDVLNACRRLKAGGYRLALDDLSSTDGYGALLDVADIVKVDFRLVPPARREPLTQELRSGRGRAQLLAEKVETPAEFSEAMELGYDYFQGYFFSRPTMFSGREIPPFKLNLLELTHAVGKPDFDFTEVEAIVKRDVSLSYKMLRFANSAAYGVRQRIKSVKHALVMLGQEEVARAVSLLAIAGLGADRPEELAVRSLMRATLCEAIHPLLDPVEERVDFFLLGMFSLVDAILERPMDEIVSLLPTSAAVDAALLGREGLLGDVLALVEAYEQADWGRVSGPADRLRLPAGELTEPYLNAVRLADEVFVRAEG